MDRYTHSFLYRITINCALLNKVLVEAHFSSDEWCHVSMLLGALQLDHMCSGPVLQDAPPSRGWLRGWLR